MAPPRTFSGARAIVSVQDPTGITRQVGIFNNASYGLVYDAQPVYILGRYSPAEIEYTAQEPVQVTCSGWRVYGHGPHVEALVPSLSDLMNHEYLTLNIVDRQNAGPGTSPIAVIRNVRPTGYSTTINARGLVEVTMNFVGILVDDESTTNEESPGKMDLP